MTQLWQWLPDALASMTWPSKPAGSQGILQGPDMHTMDTRHMEAYRQIEVAPAQALVSAWLMLHARTLLQQQGYRQQLCNTKAEPSLAASAQLLISTHPNDCRRLQCHYNHWGGPLFCTTCQEHADS